MSWVPLFGGGADLAQQVVLVGQERTRLTTKERDLLAYLAAHPDRTITRDELLVHVWGQPSHASQEPVYALVKRLRAKIDRGAHKHVVGVHGDGYRWSPAPTASERARPVHRRPAARFFGRQAELSAIEGALRAGARLVTLVGPGGAGKTRCVLELAASRPHVFCDLSSATTEATVLATIAAALDVPLDGAEPADWARGVGRVLVTIPDHAVVLDNVEHVVEVAARLASTWLPTGPALLVTSRESLRIDGEHVVPIGPLPSQTAVELFADRVEAAGGSPGDRALQARIVERVDRLPLAIELAAAQAHELGGDALLRSLDAQLATLVAGARDAPKRHATLRDACVWSWSLLDALEREALGALAVFAGSFTLDAAQAVLNTSDAAAVVAGLCRRSQMRREDERFVLYAAVRELASEHVVERASLERRHAAHYASAGEAAASLLEGPGHREAMAVLIGELAELRVAHHRMLGRDTALAARLALVMDRVLGLRAEMASSRRALLGRSRERLDDPELRCALLVAEGRIEGAPLALLEEAARLAGTPSTRAEVQYAWGERLMTTALDEARVHLELAVEQATEAGAERLRGRALAVLGEVFSSRGDAIEARARLRAALTIHVEAQDRRAIARTAATLAYVNRLDGVNDVAHALLRQAEAAAEALGEPIVLAKASLALGQHLTRTGDHAGAREALDNAAELYESVGFARDLAFLRLHVAETLVGIGDFDRAGEQARAALAAMPEEATPGSSAIREALGCIELLRGNLDEAQRWLEEGLRIARVHGFARSECTLSSKRALLLLGRGMPERAWEDIGLAARKNEARGAAGLVGSDLADRAMIRFALGQPRDAERDLARARELLGAPADEHLAGRMLAMSEIVGRGMAEVRAGKARRSAHATARARAARALEGLPADARDVPLRLLEWLVGRIAVDG